MQLLLMNALRLAAVNTIGDSLIWLGKVRHPNQPRDR
jgi:hypothetical protein